jgi:hypothetical protein
MTIILRHLVLCYRNCGFCSFKDKHFSAENVWLSAKNAKTDRHIGRYFFRSQPRMIPKRPVWPFGLTVWWQWGHLTGAEYTVAFHSMSGAEKVLPQLGQVTLMVPLSIALVFDVQCIFCSSLEEDAAGGDSDDSHQELDRNFCNFCIG